MAYYITRLLLALALAVSGFAAISTSSDAASSDIIVLPWVPNGVMIDDPRGYDSMGPFTGSVTIQNPSGDAIRAYYTSTASGYFDPGKYTDLAPHEARTLSASEIGVPNGTGSGVVVRGRTSDGEHPIPIAAVLKQASPVPQNNAAQTSSSHDVMAGYTGLAFAEVGDRVVLPIAQTNSNWNTLIRATHFEGAPNELTINLTLNPAGGGAPLGPYPQTIPAGGTATFDLLALGVPEGWVGSAVLTSEWGIAAAAERAKNETRMLIMNTSQRSPGPGSVQYAPLILRDWNFWNTGISLANLTDSANDVTVRYYAMDGSEVHSDQVTLPPNGMDFVYLPAGAGAAAFAGTAIVEGSGPLIGAVDKVKYHGDDEDTGHALSYMLDDDLIDSGDQALLLPLYQKGNPGTGGGDTSGVQLFNPTDMTVEYSYGFFDQSGNMVQVQTDTTPTLGPKQSHTIYAMALGDLPAGFTGSLTIGIASGQGGLIAISNNVNYDVQFDGSASFNLGQTEFVPFPDDPLVPPDILFPYEH